MEGCKSPSFNLIIWTKTMSLILEAVKQALLEGNATVNLKEASALTVSGTGVGGRVIYDYAFASKREHNPLRDCARIIQTIGSEQAFVVKTGNATLIQNSTNNPWGYGVKDNTGLPNIATSFWQLPVRSINAGVPVRTSILSDIDNLEEALVDDLMLEFAEQEALSMMLNNDQSGSTTVNFGATSGLRGLNSYTGSTTAAAFGSNGSAITNGVHTILEVAQVSATTVSYEDLVNLQAALPSQYLYKDCTAYMMHPNTIQQLRLIHTHGNSVNGFVEVGDDDGGALVYVFGHRVIPNPYMQVAGAGKFSVYLADWSQFMTIADYGEMTIQRFDQTSPGFIYLFAEKRVCSTVRDVFAGVRLVG
jgi:HK97 family phage major capsid protein